MSDIEKEFWPFFEKLAEASGEIARRYFRSNLAVDEKEDKTPVTQADREIEAKLRDLIRAAFPSHGLIGEEYGAEGQKSEFVWVMDPIDGTKSFISGIPLFGTVIGLLFQGKPVMGLIDQPILRERWIGLSGGFCRFNGKPSKVAPPRSLNSARCCTYVPAESEGSISQGFWNLRKAVKQVRYNIDCYAYALLASGTIDLVVEPGLNLYDIAGVIPVIEGAGGYVSDWQGRPVGLDFDGNFIASSSKSLALEALSLVKA
jgi:histidinol phosphatase-like enzyme (inositol monophosphatase family)